MQKTATPALPAGSRPVLVVLAVSSAGFYVVMAFLSPLVLPRGVNAVSGFFAAYTVSAIGIRLLGGGITARLGLKNTTVVSILIYGAAIASVAGVGPRSLVGFGIIFGLAHGALYPALMAMLFRDTDPMARAPLAGLSNGVMNIGTLTVLASGQLANRIGLVPVFILTGIAVAASAPLIARNVAAEEKDPEAEAAGSVLLGGDPTSS